jgi:hypothetical protein
MLLTYEQHFFCLETYLEISYRELVRQLIIIPGPPEGSVATDLTRKPIPSNRWPPGTEQQN